MATATATKTNKLTSAQEYNKEFSATVARMVKTRKNPITIDDVVAKIGNPPQGTKALGALMNAAAYSLDLVSPGYSRSQQPTRRGALNKTWELLK